MRANILSVCYRANKDPARLLIFTKYTSEYDKKKIQNYAAICIRTTLYEKEE